MRKPSRVRPTVFGRVESFPLFDPVAIFKPADLGLFVSPNRKQSMYQDRAGRLPSKVANDVVGIWLDESLNLGIGPEACSDPTLDIPANWAATGAAPVGVIASGVATYVGGAAGNRWIQQSNRLTVGKTYIATITAVFSAGTLMPDMSGITSSVSASGTYQWRFKATTTTLSVMVNNNFAGTISDVSVREVFGNHAYAVADNNRPLLGFDSVAGRKPLAYLARDGIDDALLATVPNLGANATVVYATELGVTTLTAQTIAAGTYNVLKGVKTYAHFVINRALTAVESSQLVSYMNYVRGA